MRDERVLEVNWWDVLRVHTRQRGKCEVFSVAFGSAEIRQKDGLTSLRFIDASDGKVHNVPTRRITKVSTKGKADGMEVLQKWLIPA